MTRALPRPVLLSGWGRSSPSRALVVEGAHPAEVRALLDDAGDRGVLVRGLGRAYGDAAQNAGGFVVTLDRAGPIELDERTGLVTAGAGVSFDRLMRELLPRGWFVPVTPGTRHVTVGGAVAADVHGKNHHVDGSWGNHVEVLWILTADGSVRRVGPDDPTGLFWATVGGMGLTGIVLACTFRARPVATSRMLVDIERTTCLTDTIARLLDFDRRRRNSVAWVDVLARGRSLGRAVITAGEHAPVEALADAEGAQPLAFAPRALPAIRRGMPAGLLNARSVAAFNALWYRRAPTRRADEVQSIARFFHPLDGLTDWNRLYGAGGFVQYQFVVPDDAVDTLAQVVERFSAARVPSFLTVLKRLGASNRGMLSFPMPGWTMTLDIPTRTTGLAELLDALDVLVVDAGGRENLAKDARLDRGLLARMYPRLDEWKQVRASVDPRGRFQSDQARRLGLC